MTGRATKIVPRVLGFIPLLVSIFCVVLLLKYRPAGYRSFVFAMVTCWVITAILMFVVIRKALKINREKAAKIERPTLDNDPTIGTSH